MKTQLIPESIEHRAIELYNTGMYSDIISAVKQAIVDEQNLIGSLLTSSSKLTSRGKIASDHLFNKIYK